MKNRHLFSAQILAVLSLAFTAGCGVDYVGNGGDDVATTKEMTLRTSKDYVSIYMAGIGTATIDWGDGSSETVTLSGFIEQFTSKQEYTHEYANSFSHTITVTGKSITHLDCSNQLTNLDVSKNTALTYLNCSSNPLTSLDVSKNTALTELWCNANQLVSLDMSKNMALTFLFCGWNQLTSLDVSKNTVLTELYCYRNRITSLDVSKNTTLTHLNCDDNPLISLDVSKSTALTKLSCNNNQLTNLNMSKNTALTELLCMQNRITSLNMSKNTALTELWCNNNQLTNLELNALFQTLHSNGGYIVIEGNPGANTCNRSIATNKGWAVDGWEIILTYD